MQTSVPMITIFLEISAGVASSVPSTPWTGLGISWWYTLIFPSEPHHISSHIITCMCGSNQFVHPCRDNVEPTYPPGLPLLQRGPTEQKEALLKDNGSERVRGQVEEEVGLQTCLWFLRESFVTHRPRAAWHPSGLGCRVSRSTFIFVRGVCPFDP